MPDKDKHKIFSKEELFKLIDERKSLPPEADDFDKDAMEGLSMLADRKKVDGLDDAIDEVLRLETAKTKRKRNLYILSAAASVILIIGLFFILKDISFDKKENVLAENTKTANDNTKPDELKVSDEKIPAENKVEEKNENTPASIAMSEKSGKGKEGKRDELETSSKSRENVSGGDAMAAPPAEVRVNRQAKTANEEAEKARDNRSQGGKDYKTSLAKEEAKKTDKKLEDKENDKTHYVTNTVWTSTPASGSGAGVALDETKNKSGDYRSKNQSDADGKSVAGNSNVAAPQKSAELAVNEKQVRNGPDKKSKANKESVAKPDTIVTDMLAGYSYNDQKPGKGLIQGGEPQTPRSATAPVQTQTESSAAFGKATDVPTEQKVAQEVSGKKTAKHESQPDNTIADVQNAEPHSASRAIASAEPADFNGGTEALQQYVKKNLKISEPKKAGTIVAEFEVNKDGKIDTGSVKITTKIKNCDPCSKDVAELVKTMPKWKPANEKERAMPRKQKLSVDYNVK